MPLCDIAVRGIHTEYAGGSFTTSFVVRVVVLRNLGAAAAGVGAVAVEFGFSEQARAGAGEDAERAVFQAGADGGDAEGEGVDAFVDREAGAAEFGDLVGAGGVGVPVDVARDARDVVTEGAVGFVVFAGEPEDVVVVEDAPDGGEGVVEAEVETADPAAA